MAAADNDHDFGMASASRPQPSTSTAHPQQAQSQPAQESHADDSLSRNVNDVTGISADASVGSDASGGAAEPRENPSGTFECNICLDTAKDAVVSMCGHLFWYVSVRPVSDSHLSRLSKVNLYTKSQCFLVNYAKNVIINCWMLR